MLRRRSRARSDARLHVPAEGTVVALEVSDLDRVWRSRVEEQDGAKLVVLAPGSPGEAVLPATGAAVTVGWPTKLGYLEAEGTVTATDGGATATWSLELRTSELSQRRSAYRLDAQLPVTFDVEELGPLSAMSRNISEGGIAIELPERHELGNGEEAGISVKLPDGLVEGRGRIIRSAPMVSDGIEVVVAFDDLDEDQAERLRQYVFDQQLARRASGLA